jgi:peptidoglycan biosynthesis protein MviN/MurJ (putative lipid II flippase)
MGNAQRSIASGLAEGSLAAINYAQRVLSLITNVSLAIGTVSLTELSVENSAGDLDKPRVARLLKTNIQTGVFILTPLCILLFIYSDRIASILYQRGHFGPASLALTANCVRWFVFSVIPGVVLAVLLRAYPAIWRPWATVWISLLWMLSTIAATAAFLHQFQALSVPAGYFVGMSFGAVVSAFGLRDLLDVSFYLSVLAYIAQVAACSGVAATVFFLFRNDSLGPYVTLYTTIPSIFVFITVFFVTCVACRDPHVALLWNLSPVVRVRKLINARL